MSVARFCCRAVVGGARQAQQGIGSRLMIAAEAWMRQDGHVRLCVDVFERNVRAIRFYERHGFVRQGVAFEPNAGVNQVLMVKG